MLFPACTGFGDAALVTDKFGPVLPTTVETVAVLFAVFGSMTEELTLAVSEITVPLATPLFTLTANVKLALVSPTMSTFVHTIVPVFPTFGIWQLQPDGDVNEASVVFAGTGTTRVALSAALGPLSVTAMV